VTINGSAVGFASSLGNGAGIGAGYGFHGTSSITNLNLGGAADFEAFAELDAAGIGAANGWFGQSLVHNIVINGGHFRAYGNHAAGIGAGYDSLGNSTIDSLIVRNGNLYASGITGIGSDPWGQVKRLEIDGTEGGAVQLDCHATSHFCFNASVIVAKEAWLVAHTNTTTFIDPVYHTGTTFDSIHITGFYTVPSTKDSFGQARLLHFGKLSGLVPGENTLTLTREGGTYTRSAPFNGSHVVGVTLSVNEPGTYKAVLTPGNGANLHLCLNGAKTGDSFTVGASGETFVEKVGPCGSGTDDSQSGGLSGGAKAGISIAVILVVAGVAGVAFFLYKVKGVCARGGGGGGGELIDSKADSPYTTDGI
jgi:hypothetical protein